MNQTTLPNERLHATDSAALEQHFIALNAEDRRLRFGSAIGDDALKAYVARIDFGRDAVFASRDISGRFLAAIHLPVTGKVAELGLSVLQRYRGLGLGNALFSRATTHLRNRGVKSVFVHCLAENGAMMHLARKHGMRMVSSGSETDAHLQLPPATAESHLLEWMDDSYARGMETARQTARFSRAVLGLPV